MNFNAEQTKLNAARDVVVRAIMQEANTENSSISDVATEVVKTRKSRKVGKASRANGDVFIIRVAQPKE